MKCIVCNERNGSTRCEGCQQLYCLPCINKHHEELAQQFHLLTDVRNELKQSIDMAEPTSKNNKNVPSIVDIDHWEREIIQRIRNIATKARTTVNEIMAKNMTEVRGQFEQLSAEIQRRQKDGNYLENDINAIKSQLEQLRNNIDHVAKRIHVDLTISNNTEWDTLIYVVEEDLASKPTIKLTQANNQSAKEKKTKTYGNLYVKSTDTTNSTSNEQTATGQQNFGLIPIQFGKTNSRPNLIDSEQRKDSVGSCTVCKHDSLRLSLSGVCLKCRLRKKQPPPHPVTTVPTSTTNIHPLLYRDSDYIISDAPLPKEQGPQPIVCPVCTWLNSADRMGHACEMCDSRLPHTSS